MTDETNKDETQNEKQNESADDMADVELKNEAEKQKPESKSEPLSTDSTKVASNARGDSTGSVMELYEESFKRFAEGEVVTGRIISIDKDQVLIDIGYKSEGQVRVQEFMDDKGNITAKVGDTVEVMVEWWDDEDERVLLSKARPAGAR